jgi:thiosulfate/3-mercaptopyruvate sulfurtransferase
LAAAGIDPAKHVVVYSAMAKPEDLRDVARVFWILEYLGYPRVSLLDGGFAKWKGEGRSIEQGENEPTPIKNLQLAPRPGLLATRKEVTKLLDGDQGVLADMRPLAHYQGKVKKDYVARAGHIPGAANMPVAEFVTGPHNMLKPREEVCRRLQVCAISDDVPVITYCNSGRSASVGYFIYRLSGVKNVAVYDGSMAEWASKSSCPVEISKEGSGPER